MSSVTIDDDLYRRIEQTATAGGETVEDFVRQTLEQSVRMKLELLEIKRNGILVVAVQETAPPIDPDVVRRHLEEEAW